MPRKYCVVYGCLNSTGSKPDLSFFKMPTDVERHSKWLRLISREDLSNKPPQNYTVCEEHFDASDILLGTHRKKLKSNSLPTRHLPDLQKKDVQTSTETTTLVEMFIQTDITYTANVSTQTPKYFLADRQRKRKLRLDPLECGKTIKVHEIFNASRKYQIDILYKLCDKLLTKELAESVKAQTRSDETKMK